MFFNPFAKTINNFENLDFICCSLTKVRLLGSILGLGFWLCFVFTCCDSPRHSEKGNQMQPSEPTKKKRRKIPKDGLVEYKRSDSTLLSRINYKNYKKHGPAVGYYRNGNKHNEVVYDQGVKHGSAKIYYENGNLYRETNYHYGVNNGMQKLYRNSGKLMAEIPFQQNFPGIGLKEYNLIGKLKTIYPPLIVEGFDSTKFNNKYIIQAYFEDRSDKAAFYLGELIQGKYLHQNLKSIEASRGKITLTYHVIPGTSVSKLINVIGVHTTRLKNPRIVQQSFRLTADNR